MVSLLLVNIAKLKGVIMANTTNDDKKAVILEEPKAELCGNVELPPGVDAIEITPAQLKEKLEILFSYIKKNNGLINVPIFIYGPPGVGKTEIITSVANKLGMHINVLIASMLEPSDVHGMPYLSAVNEENKTSIFTTEDNENEYKKISEMEEYKKYEKRFTNITDWAPDKIWLKDYFQPNVYFFDEMNMARKEVLAPLYRVILEGKIGDVDISKSIRISAGNRPEDYREIEELSLPLETRYEMYWIRPDKTSWINWADENNKNYTKHYKRLLEENETIDTNDVKDDKGKKLFLINSLIIKFINMKTKTNSVYPLYCADSGENRENYKATPRSWVRLSHILSAYMDNTEYTYGNKKLKVKDPLYMDFFKNKKEFNANKNAFIQMLADKTLLVDISGSVGTDIAKKFVSTIKDFLDATTFEENIGKKIDDGTIFEGYELNSE